MFQFLIEKTGEMLEKLILNVCSELGLSLESFLVAQGYEGCANMNGEHKVVTARIRNIVPRAFFIHCYTHRLNFALQDALNQIPEARNCLGIVINCSIL